MVPNDRVTVTIVNARGRETVRGESLAKIAATKFGLHVRLCPLMGVDGGWDVFQDEAGVVRVLARIVVQAQR